MVGTYLKHAFSGFSVTGFMDGDNVSTLNEVGGTAKSIITVGGYISKSQIIRWDGPFLIKAFQKDIGQLSLLAGPSNHRRKDKNRTLRRHRNLS